MFEIGSTLRHARERRGLGLAECERGTKIRATLLEAIEEERFERLPEPAYTRGFLRTYARFLDVDETRLVSEYDARTGAPWLAEHELQPLPEPQRGPMVAVRDRLVRPRRRAPGRRLGWLALGGVGAVAVLMWAGGGGGGGPEAALPPSPPPTSAPGAGGPAASAPAPDPAPETTATRAGPARPRAVTLRVTGGGAEGSYLEVRRGGPDGPSLFTGTVVPEESRSWRSRERLWMRVGWTPSLAVEVNGRTVELDAGTGNFLVTRGGVRTADEA